MSETIPKNYYELAEINLAKNLELLKKYNTLSSQISDLEAASKQNQTQMFNALTSRITLTSERPIDTNRQSIIELKKQLQKTGDAMVFGPIDWIMYKNQTKQNMKTLGDLVAHCQNGDTICPLRFEFFQNQWNQKYNFDELDLDTLLSDFIYTPQFQDVICNPEFNSQWWENELKKDDKGNVTKWNVAYKY
jgi:hypothetical protein